MNYLALALIASIISIQTIAATPLYVGKYSQDKQVMLMFAADKAACLENEGEWDESGESGICFAKASDNVEVSFDAKTGYKLKVDLVGTNIHTCNFEAKGKLLKNVLTAKEDDCVVKATFKTDSVSISNNGKCRDYCGMTVDLDALDLTKVTK